MTHIDTTEMYGSGTAEEIVGEAIAGRPRRGFFPGFQGPPPQHASREGTLAACDDSLVRLNTDRLDCYLFALAWAQSRLKTRSLHLSQREGKILSWGCEQLSTVLTSRKPGLPRSDPPFQGVSKFTGGHLG